MSVNTAHANGALLIHSGEYILIHCKNTSIKFSGQKNRLFQGTKRGCIYLTSHRMIFKSCKETDYLLSFSAPYITMSNIELQRQLYNTTYITGNIRSQPNGNFNGEVKFNLYLNSGGASEFCSTLRYAISLTLSTSNWKDKCPEQIPPYTPGRAWYEAPIGVYQPPTNCLNWLPTSDLFTDPKPNSVYMTDNPAPYPGIDKAARQLWEKTYETIATCFPSEGCLTPNTEYLLV